MSLALACKSFVPKLYDDVISLSMANKKRKEKFAKIHTQFDSTGKERKQRER